jgi:hypothetical protein
MSQSRTSGVNRVSLVPIARVEKLKSSKRHAGITFPATVGTARWRESCHGTAMLRPRRLAGARISMSLFVDVWWPGVSVQHHRRGKRMQAQNVADGDAHWCLCKQPVRQWRNVYRRHRTVYLYLPRDVSRRSMPDAHRSMYRPRQPHTWIRHWMQRPGRMPCSVYAFACRRSRCLVCQQHMRWSQR